MRRCLIGFAVVLACSLWSRSASAQYGMGFGSIQDVSKEIETQRKQQLSQLKQYSRHQAAATRGAYRGAGMTNSAAADRFGRMDLAGHAVPGYPAIRGDLRGRNAPHVSRGGANGPSRRRAAIHRPSR